MMIKYFFILLTISFFSQNFALSSDDFFCELALTPSKDSSRYSQDTAYRLFEVLDPFIQKKVLAMLRLGKNRDFDSSPLVQELIAVISSGKNNLFQISQDGFVQGKVRPLPGTLHIDLDLFVSDQLVERKKNTTVFRVLKYISPKSMHDLAVGLSAIGSEAANKSKRTSLGINLSIAKLCYALFQGTAIYLENNPQTLSVQLNTKVINEQLQKALYGFGFQQAMPTFPLSKDSMKLKLQLDPVEFDFETNTYRSRNGTR